MNFRLCICTNGLSHSSHYDVMQWLVLRALGETWSVDQSMFCDRRLVKRAGRISIRYIDNLIQRHKSGKQWLGRCTVSLRLLHAPFLTPHFLFARCTQIHRSCCYTPQGLVVWLVKFQLNKIFM
jgi:hypothetical protein